MNDVIVITNGTSRAVVAICANWVAVERVMNLAGMIPEGVSKRRWVSRSEGPRGGSWWVSMMEVTE